MASSQEKMKILTLVEQGKITPEEGIRLLNALDRVQTTRTPPMRPSSAPAANGPRWLLVRITDTATAKVRVNVRLPVTVLNTGMKLGARISPEIGQGEMKQVMDAIQNGTTGPVLDKFGDDEREHIEIILE